MLGLLQFLAVLVDGVLFWRLYSGFLATLVVCQGVLAWLSDGLAQWLVCAPLAIVGVAASFFWQIRAAKSAT